MVIVQDRMFVKSGTGESCKQINQDVLAQKAARQCLNLQTSEDSQMPKDSDVWCNDLTHAHT